MKTSRNAIRAATFVLSMLCAGLSFPSRAEDEPGGDAESARLAIQDPDEYAWRLFLFINRQAIAGQAGVADPAKPTIREYDDDTDVVWETWALASRDGLPEAEVFLKDGVKPGPWEDLPRQKAPKKDLDVTFTAAGHGLKLRRLAFSGPDPETDEVRINRATFEHIRENGLYSRAGVAAAFEAASASGNREFVKFPTAAKEVKAAWTRIGETDKSRYHWRSLNGQTYGLAAFHIITKDTPMWFWTDFIHEDFAADEVPGSFVDSTTRGPNATHGKDGVRDETRGSKWEHYLLKGTQLTFTDSRGVPTVLGNQIIERGNAASSSCITCHAHASVAKGGYPFRQPGFYLGLPRRKIFGDDTILRLQMDFMYSIVFRAQPSEFRSLREKRGAEEQP